MSSTRSSKSKTDAEVCIVETLNFLDEEDFKEGEIIHRTLRLSGKKAHYSYVRTPEELDAFLGEFGRSHFRYLHISCHGNAGQFFTTTEALSTEEFIEMLSPHVRERRLFLSTCLAGDSAFAKEILEKGHCYSVLAPASTIRFDDAAIFWTAFYHLRFKEKPDAMNRRNVIETAKKCAKLIGEKFRFFDLDNDDNLRVEDIGYPVM